MSLFEAIVLGLVQGLTEFLPVSSSAHLIVVPWLFGWDEPGLAFDAALHLGTLSAVIVYFWRTLLGMLRALPRALVRPRALLLGPAAASGRAGAVDGDDDARLLLLIALGSVPAAIGGVFGEGAIEAFYHDPEARRRAIVAVAIALIGLGALLWAAERTAAHQRRIGHLTWRDAVALGLAQATALVPGVSRSGATITAGLFHGLHRADAARFAFLLGIPVTAAAGGKGLVDALRMGMDAADLGALAVGMVASALAGFLAIWGLLRLLQRAGTLPFVVYRFGLGALLLLLAAFGFR